jgi:DNA-binding NarL/FixJ family response regulator
MRGRVGGIVGQVVRVVLADGRPAFAEGLGAILNAQDGMAVVGVAHDIREVVQLAAEYRPGVLLFDVSLPGGDPATAPAVVRAASPATKVLLVAAETGHRMLQTALRSGADGLLTKDVSGRQVVAAIRAAVTGRRVVVRRGRSGLDRHAGVGPLRLASLSAREREVLGLLARGWSTRCIAQDWQVAETTVRTHIQHLLEKLDVHCKAEAAAFGWEHGIVAADPSPAAASSRAPR